MRGFQIVAGGGGDAEAGSTTSKPMGHESACTNTFRVPLKYILKVKYSAVRKQTKVNGGMVFAKFPLQIDT